ncbi:MAG: hypothetical protein GEV10_25295 [Streptosporangiales bacterium]|nr:hypothetical protein [Streptosporangiales bacterium]
MDRFELRDALREAGVQDGFYTLDGVHEADRPHADGTVFLEQDPESGEWATGFWERAKRHVTRRFATEAEGCASFHEQLTRPPQPVTQISDAERAEGVRRSRESEREVRAMLARKHREHGD